MLMAAFQLPGAPELRIDDFVTVAVAVVAVVAVAVLFAVEVGG